jgi:hypothetical protein
MGDRPPVSFYERWKAVETRLKAESQAQTDNVKLAQLDALMSSVDDFGWREALEEGDEQVRQLWARLRQAFASENKPASQR